MAIEAPRLLRRVLRRVVRARYRPKALAQRS